MTKLSPILLNFKKFSKEFYLLNEDDDFKSGVLTDLLLFIYFFKIFLIINVLSNVYFCGCNGLCL